MSEWHHWQRYCGVCLAAYRSIACCQWNKPDPHRDCEHETDLERLACESLRRQEGSDR